MGAWKGSVTVRRYLVRGASPDDRQRLVKGIRAHALVPIDPRGDVDRAHGWASVEDLHELDLSSEKVFFGEALALSLRVDTLRPPAAVVRRKVDEALRALGRRPSKSEKRAMKAEVVKKLRLQAFPSIRGTDLVWTLDSGRVLFWSHGKRLNELLLELFKKSFGLDLIPDGPGQAARRAGVAGPVAPTPEMILGFPGLPGRATEAEDVDA
jgi:DNA recombination-dependent growth factor C